VNEKVKGLLQELGEAINESVTGSPRIDSIMQSIRDSGYEVYLMLEANIAVENKMATREGEKPADADFTSDDVDFLKRLKIQI
jgi:hypothetical protein